MTAWNDFNDAEQQPSFDLIPKGTLARVRMTLKPGGFDDPAQGWTGGYATQSFETGSVYLAAEFVVLEGEYARRKLWSNIGLHSPKGPAWGQMGRSFVRAILNSARNVHPQDNGPQAAAARRIQGFHELDGIEFLARIDIEKDGRGDLKNVIKSAVEPDHPDYARLMGAAAEEPRHRSTRRAGGGHPAPCDAASRTRNAPPCRASRPGRSERRASEVLGLPTTGARLRPLGPSASGGRRPALSDRLGVLLAALPGGVSRALRQLAAGAGRTHAIDGGRDDRSV
ncbi:MAG: hypothetical protein KatS3mg122_2109 [Caldimonas sp.]|nr:MAG: hypothetical protein KatS3mg122_2109 [Caldimonas sp.]